jgi:hypothetical protein
MSAAPVQAQTTSPQPMALAAERTFTLSYGTTSQTGASGRTSDRRTVNVGYLMPLGDGLMISYGLSGQAATHTPAAAFSTDAQTIGGQIGLTKRVGPIGTTVTGVVFTSQADTTSLTGAVSSSTLSRSSGIAVAISQPVPLGPNTLLMADVSYVAMPKSDTNTTTLKTTVYHRLSPDWTLLGGIAWQWSDQPVDLDGTMFQKTLRLGVAHPVSDQLTLKLEGATALGGGDVSLRAGLQYTF